MFRIFIERKQGFQTEANRIAQEILGFLNIPTVTTVRSIYRYDIENISEVALRRAAMRIFSEPQSDICYFETIPLSGDESLIVWEYLPGQYDQRADSAEQCLSLLLAGLCDESSGGVAGSGVSVPKVRCAKMVVLSGDIAARDVKRIQEYLVNPVDSRPASMDIPKTLELSARQPADIPIFTGFIALQHDALFSLKADMGLAMDDADILFLQDYFKDIGRDPSETEVRVLDTYWSDHCRHTTFNTVLEEIVIEDGVFAALINVSLDDYREMRKNLYAERAVQSVLEGGKPITLMDMACIGAKYLLAQGKLTNLEVSEEINACSIYIDVKIDGNPKTDGNKMGGESEKWLLMFKNETHNHPTEIEPFGGAATCIGGAIRDPLSGRAWVYQALRVTGAADPTVAIEKTRSGKLPQMKLTRAAALGFSSYGNQIGLATGQVVEVYHSGFEAKRMELGAVIAAAPAHMVKREEPELGDCIVLVGGGTGRDGIGGATGSSKVHTVKSVTEAAAEVQKGNAVEERKIQRLFRNPEVSSLIRRCNDFGAGGVAVAVGELTPGLEINLDAVPKKYEGLNGTELAISESQERMAVVVREKDVATLIGAASSENLNATLIARVTDTKRLVMKWRGKTIVDIERSFLDTAGAGRSAKVRISSPKRENSPLLRPLPSVQKIETDDIKVAWLVNLQDLAVCSQRGLTERFDGSIGSASVLFPMGGKYQSTPEAGCVAKIPVLYPKETSTASLMTFGYDPRLSEWSPWHGAQFAVLQSLARIAALGGNPSTCFLSFQEYFERTTSDKAWGKPTAALLGALSAQKAMGTASIGGKDSMSGTFQEIHVPPTLVSFAVTTENSEAIISGSFKESDSFIYILNAPYDAQTLAPDFEGFTKNSQLLRGLNGDGKIRAAYPVGAGGIAEALSKMSFGNCIGCALDESDIQKLGSAIDSQEIFFLPLYGSIIIETSCCLDRSAQNLYFLGKTSAEKTISIGNSTIQIEEALRAWENPLALVFPPVSIAKKVASPSVLPDFACKRHPSVVEARVSCTNTSKHKTSFPTPPPRVLIPVFPGTNCEYDMARAFALAGANTKIFVFRNNTAQALQDSLKELQKELSTCQILALSGGFSAGDEPDGSGKFIANVLREHRIADAVMGLIETRKGLILGICNGFQALIKTGLIPYGKILEPNEGLPTLTFNTVGRHISRMCKTRLTSAVSPWAQDPSVLIDGVHTIAISHGEGRVILSDDVAQKLFENGQVFSQYTDESGKPAITEPDNPNGSAFAIEGLTSPNGRILGKMGHSERTITVGKPDLIKNTLGNREQNVFVAGVQYFG